MKKIYFAYAFGAIVMSAVVFLLVVYTPTFLGGQSHYLIVMGKSMEPEISIGSLIITKPTDDIVVGDIITFGQPGDCPNIITHKVVEITDNGFRTMGVANEEPDDWIIPENSVMGEMALEIPYVGYLIYWLNIPIVYISIVWGVACLLVTSGIYSIWRNRGENRKKSKPSKTNQPRPKTRSQGR